MVSAKFRTAGFLLGGTFVALSGCESTGPDPGARTAAVPCGLVVEAAMDGQEPIANPLEATRDNIAAGRRLFEADTRPVPCAECHGETGVGDGAIGGYLQPPPTNLTCPEITSAADGMLFRIIRLGPDYLGDAATNRGMKRPGRRGAGTAMRPHRYYLTEEETWQLVLYLRELGRGSS